MTGNSDKIRSLFLTALMVFSVFAGTVAFSGAAAAANTPGIDQATEYAGNSGGTQGTVEIVFNRSVSDAASAGTTNDLSDNIDVYLDGTKVVANGSSNNNIGSNSFGITSVGPTDNTQELEFEFQRNSNAFDVTPNRNLTVVVNAVEDDSNPDTVADVSSKVDTTSRTLASASRVNVYRGEEIAITGASPGSSIEISEDDRDGGSIVVDDSLNADSNVYVYDTDELDTGVRYNVTIDGNDRRFRVNNLNLQVEMDDNDVTDEDDIIANATIRRGGEPANATLFDSDGDKVASIVKPGLKGNDVTQFNFGTINDASGFDAGDGPYTVEVTDNQTGVTATSDQINVSEAQDGEVSYESSVVTDERGDVVNITYQLENTDDAFIYIGDEDDDNYAVSGQITDDDDDGEVTVQFNSYLAGTDSSVASDSDVLTVPGDDDITSVTEHSTLRSDINAEMIEAASYNMNATAGTSQSSNADAVGTLRLSERSTENIRSWVAPRDADLTDDDIDIYDRIGQNLTQSDEIANKSLAVHQISASGIEGAIEYEQEVNGSAANLTEAFFLAAGGDVTSSGSADESNAFNLSVNKTNVGANADENPMDLTPSNTVVIEDPDNNTYFVAVETENVKYTNTPDSIRRNDNDDRITANFTVSQNGGLASDNDGVEDDYRIVERDATIDTTNDLVTLQAAAGQDVTGTTSIAPGAEIEVRLDSESESNPFILRPEATVSPNGTFTASADMSDYSAGTNFTAQVLDTNGNNLGDEEDGQLTAASTATVSISDQESDGSEVVVDSAQLSEGGFIAIHAGNASGDVVGNSDYLEAGSHEDVTITLDEPMDEDFTAVAMPHLDTNGNEAYDFPDADGPYTSNGTAVTDSANVTIVEETQTEAPDTETETEAPDTETEAPDTETEAMDTETEEAETTAAEGPGFTAAIALIALVAAALLAVRRDN